jgi:hypothetical protein
MRAMANSSRVTDVREQVDTKIVQTREPNLRGIHQIQREPNFRVSQQAQRESQPLRGRQSFRGKEESSKTTRKVSWVEEARQ